ncbi:MAG: hypothetical protein F6K00_11055 [Leptolyngbya sp. SIOISBB]|nr:hypothetical protein [Leptolyngbya sp. SIOISBB]
MSLSLADAVPSTHEAIPLAQSTSTETAIANSPPQTVNHDVCGALPEWERLSLDAQTTALIENPRYGEALAVEPLKSLFEKFWQESLITFTTYGLSARTEPVYLSGVWTGIEAMSACYEGDRPAAINAGTLAEMWLIGYQIADFVWTGETYQVTVEPTTAGLRFIQFERLENEDTLPLVVLESGGGTLTVASGDW